MEALQRYELIRPILLQEKSAKEIHLETGIPLSILYRYITFSQFTKNRQEEPPAFIG